MPVDLYYDPGSPPCRAVILTAKAINLNLNIKLVDIHDEKEHLKPEFKKLNPQSTVPTIVDDGFALWESRPIMCYLVNKYGKGSTLYPEEPKARALVDQRLYFDSGTLYHAFADYFYPPLMEKKPYDKQKLAKVENALKLLDQLLEGQKFIAGPTLTLADLSIIAGISNFEAADIDFKKHSNIKRWFETVMSTAPGCREIIEKEVINFEKWVARCRK